MRDDPKTRTRYSGLMCKDSDSPLISINAAGLVTVHGDWCVGLLRCRACSQAAPNSGTNLRGIGVEMK